MGRTCSVYLEDQEGAVILLKLEEGRFEGKWRPPGGVIKDDDKDPREAAKEYAQEQLGVDVELFPYEETIEYKNDTSYVFKGRMVGVSPEPGEGFAELKRVTYDEILNTDLAGYTEADLKRLPGDFFGRYPAQ
ncbi:MAG: NUDIX hydrolase [Candidatus Nanohaloarchaea archaeon]|nr:NUDIX hydrolase [Candidatus Nanohaloarchaea archaeon]